MIFEILDKIKVPFVINIGNKVNAIREIVALLNNRTKYTQAQWNLQMIRCRHKASCMASSLNDTWDP
jgi:hypothetical protein